MDCRFKPKFVALLIIAALCTQAAACGPDDPLPEGTDEDPAAVGVESDPNVIPPTTTSDTPSAVAACTNVETLKVMKEAARWYKYTDKRHAELRLEVDNPNDFEVILAPVNSTSLSVTQDGGKFASGTFPEIFVPAKAKSMGLRFAVVTGEPPAGPKMAMGITAKVRCVSGAAEANLTRSGVEIPGTMVTLTIDDPSGAPGHILKAPLPIGHGAEAIPNANYTIMRVANMTPIASGNPSDNQCHSGSSRSGADRWLDLTPASASIPGFPASGGISPASSSMASSPNPAPTHVYGWNAEVGCYFVEVDVPALSNHNTTPETHRSPIVGVIMNSSIPPSPIPITDLHLCITRVRQDDGSIAGPTVEWKACPAYTPPTDTPTPPPPLNSCVNVIQTPIPPTIPGTSNPAVAGVLRRRGNPLAGVPVELENCTTPAGNRSTVTDAGGAFSFDDLPNGFYRITVSPSLIPVAGQMNPTEPFLVEATGSPSVITKDLNFE